MSAVSERKLLTPGEVAAMFRVDTKTVARYARDGKLPSVRTPGGNRRFYEHEMQRILDATREGLDLDEGAA